MRLLIAQDEDRLGAHPETASLFGRVSMLPPDDPAHFLETLGAETKPFVLFWHVNAGAALELLGTLRKAGSWPDALKGVVIYRAASFAGLVTALQVRAKLHEHDLDDGIVHVFEPIVSAPPSREVITLVAAFAQAWAQWREGAPPFWRLQRAPQSYSMIGAALIAEMASRRPNSEAELLAWIDWDLFRDHLEQEGVRCPSRPEPGVLGKLCSTIAQARPDVRLRCNACPMRSHLLHSRLEQRGASGSPQEASRNLTEVIAASRKLLGGVERIARTGDGELREWMTTLRLERLHGEMMTLVGELFADQCAIVGRASRMERDFAVADEAMSSKQLDLEPVASRLKLALGCVAYPGPKVWRDD
jgi:hypothetical protein